jgi:hypothetical protein
LFFGLMIGAGGEPELLTASGFSRFHYLAALRLFLRGRIEGAVG